MNLWKLTLRGHLNTDVQAGLELGTLRSREQCLNRSATAPLFIRLRWKSYHFEKSEQPSDNDLTMNFGFKTDLTPPQNEHLNPFENDFYEMIRSIELLINQPICIQCRTVNTKNC